MSFLLQLYLSGAVLTGIGHIFSAWKRWRHSQTVFDAMRRLAGYDAALDEEIEFWHRENDNVPMVFAESLAWPIWLVWVAWQWARRRR